MRKQPELTPNRYKPRKPSGSSKFVSSFKSKNVEPGIVEKKDFKYNWLGYKWAVAFAIVIAILTYFLVKRMFF